MSCTLEPTQAIKEVVTFEMALDRNCCRLFGIKLSMRTQNFSPRMQGSEKFKSSSVTVEWLLDDMSRNSSDQTNRAMSNTEE